MKYQEMKLYFDKNKGLKSVFVSADVDSSQQAYKVDDGREALALYNEEVKVLDREYGPATIKEEFIAEKGKFYQSLSACIAKQQEWYNKRLDLNKIKNVQPGNVLIKRSGNRFAIHRTETSFQTLYL